MRRNYITALSLFFVISLLFSAQLTHVVNANEVHTTPLTSPVTNPVTGPITGPVTGPITSPAQLFTISGNVTHRIVGLFKKGVGRILPAEKVKVKVYEVFTKASFTTETDANGNYSISTNNKGWYKVSVAKGPAHFYTPPLQFVHNNKPEGKKHIDFQGVLFKF